jgi:hypothetical protein
MGAWPGLAWFLLSWAGLGSGNHSHAMRARTSKAAIGLSSHLSGFAVSPKRKEKKGKKKKKKKVGG